RGASRTGGAARRRALRIRARTSAKSPRLQKRNGPGAAGRIPCVRLEESRLRGWQQTPSIHCCGAVFAIERISLGGRTGRSDSRDVVGRTVSECANFASFDETFVRQAKC